MPVRTLLDGTIERTPFSTRADNGIGGSPRALQGIIENLPIEVASDINFAVNFVDFLHGGDDNFIETLLFTPTAAAFTPNIVLGNGVMDVISGTVDDTGIQGQWSSDGGTTASATIVAADDKWFGFGARFQLDNADDGSFIFGLMEIDTALVGADGIPTLTDGIYFGTGPIAANGVLTLSAERATNITASPTLVAVLADATWYDVAFLAKVVDASLSTNNGEIYFAVSNDRWKTTLATGILSDATNGVIPEVALAVSFVNINQGDTGDLIASVDYFWTATER